MSDFKGVHLNNYLQLTEMVSEFFEIIADPRNVSPDDFSYFYPKKYNSKNLNKKELSEYFGNLQLIILGNGWSDYRKLRTLIINILISCERLDKNQFDDLVTYYVALCKDSNTFKTRYIFESQELSKNDKYELFGSYTVFFKHIQKVVLDEMNQAFLSISKEEFDEIFTSLEAFEAFKHFCANHIYNDKLDHSFLYHMSSKKLLKYKMSKSVYLDWMVRNGFITAHNKETIFDKDTNPLESLKNCEKEERRVNFTKTLEKYGIL